MTPFPVTRIHLSIALCMGVVGCVPDDESSYDMAADSTAISQASRAFSAAFVAGDTAALGELYTEDAVLLPAGRTVTGRDAIKRFFAPREGRTQVAHAMNSESLLLQSDLAIDMGRWSSTTQREGEEPRTASERYLLVWQRQADGSWKMTHDAWHAPRPGN